MNRKTCLSTFLILSFFVFSGCNTLADAKKARGTGPYRIFNVSAEWIWRNIQGVVTASGLDYLGGNSKEEYVLAQRGITPFSSGEVVAIFITPIDPDKTRVEIVSRKVIATNVFAPDWSNEIFQILENYIKNSQITVLERTTKN